MGFLDNLKDKAEQFGERAKEGFEAAKDKASDLVDDVEERRDDESGTEPVEPAADRSPEGVGNASYGLDDAVAESTFGDPVTDAPATDPLESAAEGVDPVLDPVEPVDVTEDPLEPAPEVEPAQPPATTEDPLEPTPDRGA
jgi:hypothetical protein